MAATDFVTNPVMKAFLAGSLSGTCSTILFQPLDLVKTRVQQTSGLSVARVVEAVLQRDSVRGLWRGLMPSMARTVPGVGIYFSAMHHMKTSVCGGQPSHLQSVMIGCSARATAATLMIPLTVIKTRFESRSFGYTSTAAALRSVLGTEGVRGLVRGLGPTLVRDVPFSGLYLMFYEHLKSVAAAAQLAGSGAHFTCGVLAGVLASLVTQPADVIKTRLQLESAAVRGSLVSAVRAIYREHGARGFTRGLVPRSVRRRKSCGGITMTFLSRSSPCRKADVKSID